MLMPVIKKGASATVFFLITLLSFNVSAAMSGLPDFTQLVEKYSDAVVNISTTQKIKKRGNMQQQIPGLPNDGPFGDLLRRFFEQQSYKNNNHFKEEENSYIQTRRTNDSLGSGFIIDRVYY